MPGVGGLSIANNLLANNIQLNLNQNQASLQKLTTQLSTGLRITSPASDPAGFTVATNLETQVQGYDQASLNIQNATNAVTVATGALSSITSILQQIRSLAVEASSTLLSTANLNNVQNEIQQLTAEVNSIAQNTQFNGINLLNGTYAGYQPAVNASYNITQNSPLNTSSNSLISTVSISTTSNTILDGTFQLQVVQSNGTVSTEVFFISSGVTGLAGSLLTTISGGAAATATYNGVTININVVGTADVGSTAFVKVLQYVTAGLGTTPQFTIQTQSNEGDVIGFGIANVSAATLRIGGVNVESSSGTYNTLAAEDTIGQIDNALAIVLNAQSTLGSVSVRLQYESDNDNLASVNLQAAESNIKDLNVSQASTAYTKDQILINFGTSLLSQANTNAQSVLQLFR